MSATIIIDYTCDNCGFKETVRGSSLPEGWSGELPTAARSDYDAVYFMGGILTQPHYCRSCIAAAREGREKALADRRSSPA